MNKVRVLTQVGENLSRNEKYPERATQERTSRNVQNAKCSIPSEKDIAKSKVFVLFVVFFSFFLSFFLLLLLLLFSCRGNVFARLVAN